MLPSDARAQARPGVRHLSAAVRARTILAVCGGAVARFDESGADPDGPGPMVAALLDWDGRPYLVSEPGGPAPSGSVHLTVVSRHPGLGTLTLQGRCGLARQVTAIPGLSERLLTDPAGPAADGSDLLDIARTLAVPVAVEQVRVLLPGRHAARRVLPVPVDLFRTARPDLWTVHRADIVTHLDTRHRDELTRLVRRHAPQVPVSAIVVRDVGPDGLSLVCLTSRGVTDVDIPFDPPLADPRGLGPWLRNQLADRSQPPRTPDA